MAASRTASTPTSDMTGAVRGAATQSLPIARIREAALQIFARKGYHGSTVRDITNACGVVPAALYNHFPSKVALLQDLILEGHRKLDEEVGDALREAGPGALDQLRAFTRAVARFHAENTDLATLSNREYREISHHQLNLVLQRRRQFRETLERILSAGVESKAMQVPLVSEVPEIRMTAMSILNALTHIADWYRPGQRYEVQEVADFYASWIASSVAVPPTDRRNGRRGKLSAATFPA